MAKAMLPSEFLRRALKALNHHIKSIEIEEFIDPEYPSAMILSGRLICRPIFEGFLLEDVITKKKYNIVDDNSTDIWITLIYYYGCITTLIEEIGVLEQ